ncbi:hypothetical protein [Desulfobacter postgatei]|uniref:Uncharacterized protein n=1 Tax=Desulfobacter postgatei 2ac9 TaxID=879212 RepID=I5B0Y1_9BACT|nr:hypothetical protein [Desulfobacter postgatei]EIM63144.1 hypothetical protein DespoDRAFT_01178 [Desulfobacter postgatei 2ac9]
MTKNSESLKYRFELTDLTGIFRHSTVGAVIFLLLAEGTVPVMLRFFFAPACPYCRDENVLNCIFSRGMPKFYPRVRTPEHQG